MAELTLGEKQQLFSRLLARLINHIYRCGYAIRMGDTFRDPRVHGEYGHKQAYGETFSMHKLKLAADLNLFAKIEGKWVYQNTTEAHRQFGEWWEKQHSLCRWGGRGNDGNHYSISHDGRW